MSEKWMAVFKDVIKYAIGVILGAVGISVSGCAPTMWVL